MDFAGHVEEQPAVIAQAGTGAAVAALSAQDEIHIGNVRNHFLRDVDAAKIGEGVGEEPVPVEAVHYVDGVLLYHQGQAFDDEHVLNLHVGGDFGLQLFLEEGASFLGLHRADDAREGEVAVADIHPQVDVGGEVADGAAGVPRPKVHRHTDLYHGVFPSGRCGVALVLLLEGVQHNGEQELGDGAVVLAANFPGPVLREDHAEVTGAVVGHDASAEVVGVVVLFQLPVLSGEDGLEAVLNLGIDGGILGVQAEVVVADAGLVAPADVLAGQGEEEGHGAGAVGEGVEDVQDDLALVDAHAVKEAALVTEIDVPEGLEGPYLRVLVHPLEVPPEGAHAHGAAEGGHAPGGRDQGFLEDGRVDIVLHCDFHPEERAEVLAQGCGIYVGGIVKLKPFGNG